MKTIVEESRLYAESKANPMFRSLEVSIAEKAFKAGVEFAQHWISVEDELPETIDDEKIFLREPILIRNIDGALQVLNTFSNIGTYTHWRPIELK